MAVVPTALLLRPLPSSDHQSSTATVSTASLVGSSSSHGPLSLFLHHRRRTKSFRPAIARITPVEENLDEEEQASPALNKRSLKTPPPWEQGNASIAVSDIEKFPPWRKESSKAASVASSRSKAYNYRPAPWQQGSPSSRSSQQGRDGQDSLAEGGPSAQPEDADAEQSAMARIVEKLQHIQKAFDPADHGRDVKDVGNDSAELGRSGPRGSMPGTRVTVRAGQRAAFHSRKRMQTERGRFDDKGRFDSKGRFDGKGKIATELPSLKSTWRAMDDSGSKALPSETLVLDGESEGLVSKFPWEKDEKAVEEEMLTKVQKRGPRVPTLAELTLPRDELIRLRLRGLQLEERLRIGKLGITKSIVVSIQEQFRTSELVKVRCEGPAAASIKKTHLELEEKTGGLVVLRTGKIIVVYRGSGYKAKQRNAPKGALERKVEGLVSRDKRMNVQAEIPLPDISIRDGPGDEILALQEDPKGQTDSDVDRVGISPIPNPSADLHEKSEVEAEAESILEGLGPRFENWAGLLPVPIDADLLPQVIPNYRPPFRLMPYGIKPRISDTELTNLRRLARPLAPHFVLGRNRGHQGLAAAMVKLWEKSEVAKIAVKRRVQNTNNLIMADELKRLTGGILLSRDKFFMTFYRGKDFVPEKVAAALVEREASVRDLQDLEEKAREERSIPVKWTPYAKPSVSVIGDEAPAAKPSWTQTMDIKEQERLKKEVVKLQRLTLASQLEKKLNIASKKKTRAEEELKKLDVFLNPIDRPIDVETITEEERFMFRKLGLKMKAYLLIGRRGVFDGVVENMHLHWKHRELVKIVVKEVDVMEVQDIARTLEYESGGVLVAVAPTRKGQAIIMYRGKNYQRPVELRPRNLLSKRKALKKSLELQRHEDLSRNIKCLQDQILSIQAELKNLSDGNGSNDGGLSEGLVNCQQNLSTSGAESDGLLSSQKDESKMEEGKNAELTKFKVKGGTLDAEMDRKLLQEKFKELERLVRSGPLFRADPLSNPEKLQLRKEALSSGKAPQFFVGKNNGLEGLARGIRIFFLYHHLAKIVVKGRKPDVLMEDLIHDLEELTGGVLVSREANKIIMYRGWSHGHTIPFAESLGNITPELLSAIEAEKDWEDESVYGETEESDEESELEDDYGWPHASALASDDESQKKSDEMAIWEDIDEGSDEDSAWDDDDDDENDDDEDDDDDEGEGDVHSSSFSRNLLLRSDHKSEDFDGSEEDGDEEEALDVQARIDDRVEDEDEDDQEEEEEDSDQDSSWDIELDDLIGSEDEEEDWEISSSFETLDEDESDQKLSQEPVEAW